MEEFKRVRMFEISQDCDKWNYESAINWLNKIGCKYMLVKHDKDETRSHFHLLVNLNDNRNLEDICKFCETSNNFIEFKKKWKDALAYLFHLTEKAKQDGKHIYDKSALICAKGCTYEEIIQRDLEFTTIKGHDLEVKELMYKYGNLELSFNGLMEKISVQDFVKHNTIFKRCKEYRQYMTKDRKMTVIYIYGESGSGKTTYAKFLARQNNFDYFVSGSGKDTLDGYDKEECIILDDLRDDSFSKSELFKLTDNNTNSSVKSRYQNKDISQCKLMIITSIKSPYALYDWQQDKIESFKQFNRRLQGGYVYVPSNEKLPILYIEQNNDGKTLNKRSLPISFEQVKNEMGIKSNSLSNFDMLCANSAPLPF